MTNNTKVASLIVFSWTLWTFKQWISLKIIIFSLIFSTMNSQLPQDITSQILWIPLTIEENDHHMGEEFCILDWKNYPWVIMNEGFPQEFAQDMSNPTSMIGFDGPHFVRRLRFETWLARKRHLKSSHDKVWYGLDEVWYHGDFDNLETLRS